MKAFGHIETYGLVSAVEAADAALKAADVTLEAVQNATGARISITLRGEVGAVKAAVEAGEFAASKIGQVVSANVIPRLDSQVDNMTSHFGDNVSFCKKTKAAVTKTEIKPAEAKVEVQTSVSVTTAAPVPAPAPKVPAPAPAPKNNKHNGKKK